MDANDPDKVTAYICIMQIIDESLLCEICAKAQVSPRLRMNYNFHTDLTDKCQRLLNAMEPGTIMPIHHHKVAEMYIALKGKLEVQAFDDDGNVIERVTLAPKEGCYGIQIPPNTWHSLEVLEKDTVIFEVKEGPFIPHFISGILEKVI